MGFRLVIRQITQFFDPTHLFAAFVENKDKTAHRSLGLAWATLGWSKGDPNPIPNPSSLKVITLATPLPKDPTASQVIPDWRGFLRCTLEVGQKIYPTPVIVIGESPLIRVPPLSSFASFASFAVKVFLVWLNAED